MVIVYIILMVSNSFFKIFLCFLNSTLDYFLLNLSINIVNNNMMILPPSLYMRLNRFSTACDVLTIRREIYYHVPYFTFIRKIILLKI